MNLKFFHLSQTYNSNPTLRIEEADLDFKISHYYYIHLCSCYYLINRSQ